MGTARALVLMDYQNVHLTGWERFAKDRGLPKHDVLIHPLAFGAQVVDTRNSVLGAQHMNGKNLIHPLVELAEVQVFRGCPSNKYNPTAYRRSQMQKSEWERSSKVHVNYRTLKYHWSHDRDAFVPQEKGVDVMFSLSGYRAAMTGTFDVVILASHDTDIIPTIEAICEDVEHGDSVVETVGWQGCKVLKASDRQTWRTTLGELSFVRATDRKDYSLASSMS